MSEKNLNARIIHKHDTEANWQKATSFIPKQGELIVYDIDSTYSYERFKIGDGSTVVSSLPFADANKVDKIDGKGLSTNDYTDADKSKLAGIAEGANKTIVDTALSSTSTNPVQNKVINDALAGKAASSHGNHVPATETANNAKFLRNDNTWQTVTPANIGAAEVSHTHNYADSDHIHDGVTTSGNGAAYVATVPGITSLVSGVSFIMIPHTVSTSTTPTLNVNGLGAKTIRRRLSSMSTNQQTGYAASWLAANMPIRVIYDGSYWIVEGQPKPMAADFYGNVPVSKGGTGASDVAGALENLGLKQIVVSTSTSTLPTVVDGAILIAYDA